MRFEACIAVLLTSLVVFASCSDDGDGNHTRRICAGQDKIWHLDHHEDKKYSTDNATEHRSKRSLSYSDRDTVLYNFNYRRGLVGASDMNYLEYDTGLEVPLSNWTSYCNYDAKVYMYNPNDAFVLKVAFTQFTHAEVIQDAFSNTVTSIFNGVRSKYVTGVAGSVDYCSLLIANGRFYYGAYLIAYGFMESSGFDATVRQYTLGPACTQCRSNVGWCYNSKLCRADCSSYISGCSQISNGRSTDVGARTSTSTTTTTTTTTTTPPPGETTTTTTPPPGETRAENINYGSGARGIEAFGTVILYGLLLVLCHHFQEDF